MIMIIVKHVEDRHLTKSMFTDANVKYGSLVVCNGFDLDLVLNLKFWIYRSKQFPKRSKWFR